MLRFLKIFLGQLLKTVLIVLGIGLGFYCTFPVESWLNPQGNPSQMLWWFIFGFSAIGFLFAGIIPFLIEYRQKLSILSLLGEMLLGLIALVSIGVGIFLVIALGMAGYATTNSAGNDPHGFLCQRDGKHLR